jgi:hypothetical protein
LELHNSGFKYGLVVDHSFEREASEVQGGEFPVVVDELGRRSPRRGRLLQTVAGKPSAQQQIAYLRVISDDRILMEDDGRKRT